MTRAGVFLVTGSICLVLLGSSTPANNHSATTRGGFDLSWRTIDGGGETFSTGGGFELGGTIGQPDAGYMAGGTFELTGGFWVAAPAPPPTVCADLDADGDVDLDDFAVFASCYDGSANPPALACPPGADADLDDDGDVDLDDFAVLASCYNGSANPPAGTCPPGC